MPATAPAHPPDPPAHAPTRQGPPHRSEPAPRTAHARPPHPTRTPGPPPTPEPATPTPPHPRNGLREPHGPPALHRPADAGSTPRSPSGVRGNSSPPGSRGAGSG